MIVAGELRRRLLRHGQPARKRVCPVRVAYRDLRSGPTAALAFSAKSASISIAMIFPVGPVSSAMIAV